MRRLSSSKVRGWATGFGRSMGYPPLRLAGAEDSRGPTPVHAALPEGYVHLHGPDPAHLERSRRQGSEPESELPTSRFGLLSGSFLDPSVPFRIVRSDLVEDRRFLFR